MVHSLKSFNQLINRYLYLDPESEIRLARLEGKVIHLRLIPTQQTIQCLFKERKLELSFVDVSASEKDTGDGKQEKVADVTLIGSPLQLVAIMINKENRPQAFQEKVKLIGDAALAQTVIHLFDQLDIDWEEQLSRWVGDVPAYYSHRAFSDLREWAFASKNSFTQDLNDYVHEELQLFPRRQELQELYQEIDDLRMDCDRLQARISQLRTQIEEEPS